MGDQQQGERTSWVLVAALCLFLASGAAVRGDDYTQEQQEAAEQKRTLEERQFAGDTNPAYGSSFVKSKFSGGVGGTKGRKVGHYINERCESEPRAPLNSQLRCSKFSGCQVICLKGYQLPNGERKMVITCQNGEWRGVGFEVGNIPDCQPICLPECLNNGICVGPNQCNCAENFSGPQCQFESKPCLNRPPLPMNSKITCNSKFCTIQCLTGHKFPDGTGVTNLLCEGGQWRPNKAEWTVVPDCEPECNPSCQNGGKCLSFNKCQCSAEFRGPQCQYSADRCQMTKLEFNGGRNCSGNNEIFKCSISCPSGVDFEYPPAPFYTCRYETGTFVPTTVPQCQYGNNVLIRPIHGSHFFSKVNFNSSTFSSVSSKGFKGSSNNRVINNEFSQFGGQFGISREDITSLAKTLIVIQKIPGTCVTWGGTHYKTFDGRIYSVQSQCSYTLVQDKVDNTFVINVEPVAGCKEISCGKKLKIFVDNKEFTLSLDNEKKPQLKDETGKLINIPGQISELSTQRVHNFVIVKLAGVGVSLKWDTKDYVAVDVSEALWNKTGGLCGRIDGYKSNDYEMKDGSSCQTVLPFVNTWEVDSLGERCTVTPNDDHPCGETTSAEVSVSSQASDFCNKILKDIRFEACRAPEKNIDFNAFYESCRWDYCAAARSDNAVTIACKSVASFVEECLRKGVALHTNWRDESFCPMECSNGKVYKQCAPASEPTCRTATIPVQKAEFCVEGCFCPEGTVLHNEACIPINQCPCGYRGREFANGAIITKGCNTCRCTGGQWQCTKVQCGARCAAVGDPHYTTFDGRRYDFMGKCSYYLVWNPEFTVEAENVACQGAISEAMGFAPLLNGLPSCTKTLTIKSANTTVKLRRNREVQVNGEEIVQFPARFTDIKLRIVSSIFIVAELQNGIEVWWDSMSRVYIDVPSQMHGKISGLCGTFNENQFDDFATPEGDIEQSVEAFANKWKTQATCEDLKEKTINHPCEQNLQNKVAAEAHCKKLKGPTFSECHWIVDVEPFYQDCLYDVCSCQGKIGSCLCPVLSAYAKECVANGIQINWRHEVRECGIHCPGSQRYQVCGDSCARSCRDISYNARCKTQCVEGCNCPPGQTLDKDGNCILIAECPCLYKEVEYPPGHKEVRPGEHGLEFCTCNGAQWQCIIALPQHIEQYPQPITALPKCSATKNFEPTKCEPVDPVTCQNMHLSETGVGTSPAVCQPGCKCKKGYVLDSDSQECVLPSKCPCHHGGRSYKEGEVTQEHCNVCKCSAGSWDCTSRLCPGICTAWGDSHFKTFDGKIFDFEGACDYILTKSKGPTLTSDSFSVSIQNVQCGSSGVTCAKSVTINIGNAQETETVVLTKDKPVPSNVGLKRTIIRQAGLFVFVEVTDLGLVVQWDKGTRIYIKIKPEWMSRLEGLCGNYNADQMDDFQTPSGGVTEVSARLFGDSWRLQEFCAESTDIEDTCELHPHRKVWAIQKCGILKSKVFQNCHSQVPVGPYMDRCLLDTCGCDLGGDCECLCTAIAAYAQECNVNGVPIKWRSQELCPIQCDESCAQYSSCVSTCPKKTCDNKAMYKSLTLLCQEDACVEGCQLKPCPPGEIYKSLTDLKCTPENKCERSKCVIDGKTYYEGDLIRRDDCHSCHCSHQKEICQGEPCTTTTSITPITTPVVETTTPPQMQEECISGWSRWFSKDKPIAHKHPNDIELLDKFTLKDQLPCTREEMVDIKCRTVGTHLSIEETGQKVKCTLEQGLVCFGTANDPCLDYEFQVLCKCKKEKTTPGTTATETATPFTIPTTTTPTMVCVSGWTEWMDSNKPDRNGEFENTDLLRHLYSFCPDHMIHETQCRTVNTKEDSHLNDVLSLCDRKGLRCSNKGRGDMMCENYEIRFRCECECLSGMGMESGEIKDSQISVSSFDSIATLGHHARLNGPGAWIPQTSYKNIGKHWIQVSFNEPKKLTGIDLQGHPHKEGWVQAYSVSVSNDGETWNEIFEKDSNWPKKFKGNSDQNTKVRSIFPEPLVTQFIRIHPKIVHNTPALRFEILGCDILIETTTEPQIITTPTTKKPPVIAPCVENAWTPWMNSHTPSPGNWDEFEDYASLRKKYSFCDTAHVKNIKCRSVDTLTPVQETGQNGVTCNLNTGLQCNDRLQAPEHCLDYEVSLYCQCEKVDLCESGRTIWAHDSKDCYKYNECVKNTGDTVEKTCGQYMMFNPKTLKCDWPDDVIKIRPECEVTTEGPTEETTEGTTEGTTTKLTTHSDEYTTKSTRCTDVWSSYTVGHETDCDKFYYCMHGREELSTCDPGTIYSQPHMGCMNLKEAEPSLPHCKPTEPTCEPYWTEWFNSSHPNVEFSEGDFELIENLRQDKKLTCEQKYIKKIECQYYKEVETKNDGVKSKKGGKTVVLNEKTAVLSDAKKSNEIITCSKKLGLLCYNVEQVNGICYDYAMRLYCSCGTPPLVTSTTSTKTSEVTIPTTTSVPVIPEDSLESEESTTVTSTTTTPVTTTTAPKCKPGWTEWFNTTHPEDDDGDYEIIDDIRRDGNICEKQYIKNIECKYYDDVEITEPGTKRKKSSTQRVLQDYTKAQEAGHIVSCKKSQGLACSNVAQVDSMCHDYAMRVFCECEETSTPYIVRTTPTTLSTTPSTVPTTPPTVPTTPTTVPTTPTTIGTTTSIFTEKITTESVCPPGQVWKDCAIPCELVCHFYEYELKLQGFCDTLTNCKAGCVDEQSALACNENGFRYRSNTKCVREENCPCASRNGTIIPPGNVYTENGCERCQCLNNKYLCDDSPCKITTKPPEITTGHEETTFSQGEESTTMHVITVTRPGTHRTTIENQVTCNNGWTSWANRVSPNDGNEFETLNFLNPKCKPLDIECRTTRDDVDWKETGQIVKCDIENGLECFKDDNFPGGCFDYKIRVNCFCYATSPNIVETTPTEVTSPTVPTPTEPVTVASTPVPCDGWSQWFNDGHPDEDGLDRENKLSIELRKDYNFCSVGFLTDIECAEADSERNYVLSDDVDVSCTLENGLTCHNADQQPGRQCRDYKIRYYCSCDQVTTTKSTIYIPSTISPPPQCDENAFIDLVNGPIPLPDTAFKATTSLNADFAPHYARIIQTNLKTVRRPSWVAGQDDIHQFLQVDLGRVEPVYGVTVQGNQVLNKRVTSYHVDYSTGGNLFTYATEDDGKPQVFHGPIESSKGVKQIFTIPFEARYIRFKPLTWHKGIAMNVEIHGCGEIFSTTEFNIPTTSIIYSTTSRNEVLCDEEMGLENKLLGNHQIHVSSVLDDNYQDNGPNNIRLNSVSAWRPSKFGSREWVVIDFMEPRNISGIITQGDEHKNAWVESYTVQYSHDNINWNPVLDKDKKDKVFLANFDSSTPYKNVFNRMIHAQFLKILPQKVHNFGGLRLEVIGCYHPYPPTTEPPVVTTTQPSVCNSCPGLPEEKMLDCIDCQEENKAWNGRECIFRTDCSCYVGHTEYKVGIVFEKEDCQKCVCKIGGHIECTREECKKCDEGLQSVKTPLCSCVCKPCPEGTKLCPTSNVCVNLDQWCDGVEDCPDDELNCLTTTTPPPTTPACPTEPTCPPGHTLVEKKPESTANTKKVGVKGTKTGVKGRPQRVQQVCSEYECVLLTTTTTTPIPCPPPDCPRGTDVIKIDTETECPKYQCRLVPPNDECKVDEKNFQTFDETYYQYAICNHILAQDKDNNKWKITVEKICSEDGICRKHLTIDHDEHKIKIRSDFAIEYDGYTFTVEQAESIGSKHQEFLISRLGKSVLFESNHYGFRVSLHQSGTIKVEMPSKLRGSVDGLCGLYDGIQENDKTKPNGDLVKGTQEFGDSWAVPGTDEHCQETACGIEVQTKAIELCSAISDKYPLNLCKDAISVKRFIINCIEHVCKCLEHTKNEEDCRCDATLKFFEECQVKSPDLDLSSWRLEHNCPIECPPGEVYKDCFKHKCERTCANLKEKDPCPIMEDTCISGCYCADGLVRKKDKCIKTTDCQDCVCNGYGDPQYLTFDRHNYTFNGNCTYVASRDITKDGKHNYQVLATNMECIEEPGTTCTYAITVVYNNHVIYIRRDEQQKQIITTLHGQVMNTFPYKNDWLKLDRKPGKSVTVRIEAIHLEVAYMYYNYAFVVRLPSQIYGGNKTEGLCANCNKEKSDDLRTKDDVLTDNIDEFGMSWLVKNLPPGLPPEENCQPLGNKTECLPLPPDDDPCLWIMDKSRFGQCHAVVDPASYVVSCQFDVCHSLDRKTSACRDVQAYAQECEENGICVDWRRDDICPFECPAGMEYKACSCAKTCENYELLNKDPKACAAIRAEGCVCKSGKVLNKNGKCVEEIKCNPCDDEGHAWGEEWHPDKCTTCTCNAQAINVHGNNVQCTVTQCPEPEICKAHHTSVIVEGTENDCCPKRICKFDGCPQANPITCGPYQEIKDISTEKCPKLICECIPATSCPPLNPLDNLSTTSPSLIDLEPGLDINYDVLEVTPPDNQPSKSLKKLEPGMVAQVNNSGCCPHIEYICQKDTCPEIRECEQFYKRQVVDGTENLCCPKQICVPPKDACIYEHKFIASEKGGEQTRTEGEKKIELKKIDAFWQDGPCVTCNCLESVGDLPKSICTRKECSTVEQHPDYKDYVLEAHFKVGECCTTFKRKACKVDGGEYEVGEEWPVLDDKCSVQTCVEEEGIVQKQTKTEKCNTECDQGWVYEAPSADSTKCCGQCKQIACVVNGRAEPIGTNWYSDDGCSHYFCDVDKENGTVQVQVEVKMCPEINEEELQNYVLESTNILGDCCNKTTRIACLHDGKQYDVGAELPSTDKCMKYICARNEKGEIYKQENKEICQPCEEKGSVYIEPPADSDKCCGSCRQEHCVINGELKKPGDKWFSINDNCTELSCYTSSENNVQIMESVKICPVLDNCKPGSIRLSNDGCCKTCDPQSENQVNCEAKLVNKTTVGLIKEQRQEPLGLCMNPDDIPDFRECLGFCESKTRYNSYAANHVSDCKCCQAESFDTLNVILVCEDDTTFTKAIQVPKSCSCSVCVAQEGTGTKAGIKTGTKTGIKTGTKTVPIKRQALTDIFDYN